MTAFLAAVSYVVPTINLGPITTIGDTISNTIFKWMSVLSPVVDIPVLMTCITLSLTVVLAGLIFRIGNYVFNHIPLIGAFG